MKDDNRLLREKIDELKGRLRDHLKITRPNEKADDLWKPDGNQEVSVHLKKLN